MKKPNPIFLGLIATVALLPHVPRLLLQDEPQPVTAQQSPHIPADPLASPAGLPTAELPSAPGDSSDCTQSGADFPGYENTTLPLESGSEEVVPTAPLTNLGEGCDTEWNLSQTRIHLRQPLAPQTAT